MTCGSRAVVASHLFMIGEISGELTQRCLRVGAVISSSTSAARRGRCARTLPALVALSRCASGASNGSDARDRGSLRHYNDCYFSRSKINW